MSKAPMVSVCCITYNHERYIRQCLEGILAQKCDFEYEVLIHDDASTDNTAQIISEYSSQFPNEIITILQLENQYSKGIKPLIHFLFPQARGKYIAICEGDDYWTDPLKLQKQFDFMEENPQFTLCTHDFLIHYEHKNILDTIASEKFAYLKSTPLENSHYFEYNISDFAIHLDGLHTATNFIRLETLRKVQGFFSYAVVSGDYLLKILLLKEGKGCFIPDVMSVLRKNAGGITQRKKDLLSNFNAQRHQLEVFADIAPAEAKKYFYRRLWKIYPNYILNRGYNVPLMERLRSIKPFFKALFKSV